MKQGLMRRKVPSIPLPVDSFRPWLCPHSWIPRSFQPVRHYYYHSHYTNPSYPVNLGNSGLRVSKLILGCMSYGSPEWQKWVLGEEEAMLHIKAACVVVFVVPPSALIY